MREQIKTYGTLCCVKVKQCVNGGSDGNSSGEQVIKKDKEVKVSEGWLSGDGVRTGCFLFVVT